MELVLNLTVTSLFLFIVTVVMCKVRTYLEKSCLFYIISYSFVFVIYTSDIALRIYINDSSYLGVFHKLADFMTTLMTIRFILQMRSVRLKLESTSP